MHRIHLRGFWDVSEPEAGRVRFTRRFGCPTANPDQKMTLSVAAQQTVLAASVNGEPLSRAANTNSFVLSSLKPRNVLCIDTAGDSQSPQPEAVIEIEEA